MSFPTSTIKQHVGSARLRAMALKAWLASGVTSSGCRPSMPSKVCLPPSAEDENTATEPSSSVMALALRPLFRRVGELAALSLAINLLSLAVPIFVLQVYDRVVFHGGLATLGGLVIGVIIALGFDFILRQARSRLIQMVALRVDVGLIRALFEKLNNLPLRRLESQRDSDWHGLLRDQEFIRDTLAGPATILLVDLPFHPDVFIMVIWLVAQLIAWLSTGARYLSTRPVAALSSWAVGVASRREQDAVSMNARS